MSPVIHLDSAAAGRQRPETLRAPAEHARLEADVGAYVAEESVGDVIAALRDGCTGDPAPGLAAPVRREVAVAPSE